MVTHASLHPETKKFKQNENQMEQLILRPHDIHSRKLVVHVKKSMKKKKKNAKKMWFRI